MLFAFILSPAVFYSHQTARFFIEQKKSSNQKVLQFKVYYFCLCSGIPVPFIRLRWINSMSIRVVNVVYCCECLLQGNQRMGEQLFKTFVFIWIRLRSLVKIMKSKIRVCNLVIMLKFKTNINNFSDVSLIIWVYSRKEADTNFRWNIVCMCLILW